MKLFAVAMLFVLGLGAQQFPRVEGENLLGEKVTLPDAAAGRPTAIVIGFTHASQKQVKSWGASVQEELPIYSMAVLEDAPKLVRGMAFRGIKGSVPEEQRGRFLVIYQHEKELKQAAGFDQPDEAYVFLLDKDSAIHWR